MLICSSICFIEHGSAFVWLQKRTLNYCTYFAITNIILDMLHNEFGSANKQQAQLRS